MMKKNYVEPQIKVSVFDTDSIVTASAMTEPTAVQLAEQGLRNSDFYSGNSERIQDILEF